MVKDPAINIHICTHRHRPIYTQIHIPHFAFKYHFAFPSRKNKVNDYNLACPVTYYYYLAFPPRTYKVNYFVKYL